MVRWWCVGGDESSVEGAGGDWFRGGRPGIKGWAGGLLVWGEDDDGRSGMVGG